MAKKRIVNIDHRIGLEALAKVWHCLEVFDHRADFLHRARAGWRDLLFDHRQRWLEMFGLETAAGVFAQLAAEEAFGLIVLNVVIAPMAAPAVGLAQFAPAAGRINGPTELGGIDEGFDHQHRMAVMGLPIGGKPIQGQAQHLARQVGYGALR